MNEGHGVRIEVEGAEAAILSFERAISLDLPPPASIARIERRHVPDRGEKGFRIAPSANKTKSAAAVLPPDLAICEECAVELRAPESRRYRYPFTNCARCGPRYSIAL